MKTIVVGGGLAGLVAARHLGRAGVEVELLEREREVGGRVRSRSTEGFVLDRGFQVLFTAYPAVRRELDLDALDLRYFSPGATIARPGNRRAIADPRREPGLALSSFETPDLTLADKCRLLLLWRTLSGSDDPFSGPDRSVRTLLEARGFSGRSIERFFEPFYGGITLDASLSGSAAVFEYTFGTLADGSIALPAAGMGAIPAQLETRLEERGVETRLDTEVIDVSKANGADSAVTVETTDRSHEADAVVVATDPLTARELTGVETIPTGAAGCVTQYFDLATPRSLDTGRRLLLNAGDSGPAHVAPLSAVAPEYAPDGHGLLAATFLGTPEAGAEELAEESRETISAWYPERDLELSLLETDRIEFAQFAQPPGFYRTLPSVDSPDGPVFLAGEYTNWSSIQGAMESGRTGARAVLDTI